MVEDAGFKMALLRVVTRRDNAVVYKELKKILLQHIDIVLFPFLVQKENFETFSRL